MERRDTIRVTYEQNPAIKEAMRNVSEGDKGTCEVKYVLKSKDEEGVSLIIDAVIPDGYEVDEEGDGGTMSSGSLMAPDSTMSPLAMMVRKKQVKKTSVGPDNG